MNRTPHTQTRVAVAVVIALSACPAFAADFDLAGGRLSVNGSIYAGTVIRTDDRNPELLPAANAALVGTEGTGVGGKNQGDGSLNFEKNDAVSRALKGLLEISYHREGYGVIGQIAAWDDFALTNGGRPFGNLPNNYTDGAPLSV